MTTLRAVAILIACMFISGAPASAEPLQVKSVAKGADAVVTADLDRFAGAISSLRWNGVEFLDQTDHGRELQSAMSFENLGPCFNPTEAGSQADGRGPRSSSKIMFALQRDDIIHTKVDAAFWLKPGTPSQKVGCGWGARPDVKSAVNSTVTGGYLIEKAVRFGYNAIENSLRYDVTFTVPSAHSEANFDVVAAYLPELFSEIYVFDRGGQAFSKISKPKSYEYTRGPIIFSSKDATRAFGVLCDGSDIKYVYHVFSSAHVSMTNCIQTPKNISPGQYKFSAGVFFGTLEDVKSGFIQAAANGEVGVRSGDSVP